MKVLFLTNNDNTLSLYNWLSLTEEVTLLKERIGLSDIVDINPGIIISYNYKYLIAKEIIEWMHGEIINLHISLLPWNRGASPNLWSFVDDTPKGVTIHYINEKLDEGEIIVQEEVFFDESRETLRSTYEKLHERIQKLFKDYWGQIKKGKKIVEVEKMQGEDGSYHCLKDVSDLLEKVGFSWDDSIQEFKRKLLERDV